MGRWVSRKRFWKKGSERTGVPSPYPVGVRAPGAKYREAGRGGLGGSERELHWFSKLISFLPYGNRITRHGSSIAIIYTIRNRICSWIQQLRTGHHFTFTIGLALTCVLFIFLVHLQNNLYLSIRCSRRGGLPKICRFFLRDRLWNIWTVRDRKSTLGWMFGGYANQSQPTAKNGTTIRIRKKPDRNNGLHARITSSMTIRF